MAENLPSKVIGVFEEVSFPSFGMSKMTAKIDTGAFTGSLHCTMIKEVERANGKVLRFSPFDHPDKTITAKQYIVSHVKSSNGKREVRYFITTDIEIANETYEIVLTLADRSEMKWPVLIGRRFLRRNHFVVDARKPNQYRKPRKA